MNSKLLTATIATLLIGGLGQAHAYFPTAKLVKYVAQEAEQVMTPSAQPKPFAPNASYTLCFVPNGASCQQLLVDAINGTKKTLLIQAYSFTSAPIAKAVEMAHNRGVDVRVIVDKSQATEKYSSATFLKNAGIPVVVDNKPAIAHNKVMIFDSQAVFTGSFNFSKAAQFSNAENGMLVRGDAAIVKAYTDNWNTRHQLSVVY